MDTKSRAAWTRLLHEHPNARKYKGGNKKEFVQGGLLRPQAGQDRLHERPGLLLRRPLAAVKPPPTLASGRSARPAKPRAGCTPSRRPVPL